MKQWYYEKQLKDFTEWLNDEDNTEEQKESIQKLIDKLKEYYDTHKIENEEGEYKGASKNRPRKKDETPVPSQPRGTLVKAQGLRGLMIRPPEDTSETAPKTKRPRVKSPGRHGHEHPDRYLAVGIPSGTASQGYPDHVRLTKIRTSKER
jgi:hypothetical protein